MIYVLLILFPLAIAGGSFVLRRQTRLVDLIGAAAVVVEGWLAISTPIDQPTRLLEASVNYDALGRMLLVSVCLGTLLAMLMAANGAHGEYFVTTALLLLGCAAAIIVVQEPFVIATLLLLASLIGGVQLVDQPVGSGALIHPQTIGMALKYTLMIVLGSLLLLVGFVLTTAFEQQLATTGPALRRMVFGLLFVGFGVRLGLVPFHLWLPDLVEDVPPSTIFMQTGLLTVLAIPVMLVALQTQPELLVGNISGRRLLIGLGALSAIVGGGGALVSYHTRRALAFLTLANLGLLAAGLGIASVMGVTATLTGALNHVLAVALLALGLTLLERQVPGRREQAGALRERPIGALAFLIGVLMLIGAPPLSGWMPRLLLIAASRSQSWLVTTLMLAGIALTAIGGARVLRRVLLQPREAPTTRSLFSDDLERLGMATVPYAPRTLLALIVVLALASVVVGLWPEPLLAQIEGVVGTLRFLTR